MRLSAALYSSTHHPWLACLKSAQLQRIARATGIQSSGTKGVLIDRIAAELTLQSQLQSQLQLQPSTGGDCVADEVADSSCTRSRRKTRPSKGQPVDLRSLSANSRSIKSTAAKNKKTNPAGGSESNPAKSPWSILSIDMGIRNLAFAHLLVPRSCTQDETGMDTVQPAVPKLTAWHRLAVTEISSLNLTPGSGKAQPINPVELGSRSGDVSDPSEAVIPVAVDSETQKDQPNKTNESSTLKEKDLYAPDLYAANAYTLISSLLAAYRPTHVLIERQRFRSGGGSAVQEWTLRVGVFEGMLYSVLHTLRQERGGDVADLVVRGVEPRRVVRYWLEGSSESSEQGKGGKAEAETAEAGEKSKEKEKKKKPNAREVKKLKIDLVGRWLSTAMQNADADDSPGRLEPGVAADNKIVLADASECPVVHGVADAYVRKWQGERQTSNARKGKGARGSKSISSSASSSSLRNANQDEQTTAVDLGKLDDLADCLLQGITWVEWQVMRERIARDGIEALDSMP
ncbi:DNA-binding SAP [Penicillium sp. IBT 31633x]|nr:DNA-binding SAP [Penicillium sp. IBT 31633x]